MILFKKNLPRLTLKNAYKKKNKTHAHFPIPQGMKDTASKDHLYASAASLFRVNVVHYKERWFPQLQDHHGPGDLLSDPHDYAQVHLRS